jgi:hypothetical protein
MLMQVPAHFTGFLSLLPQIPSVSSTILAFFPIQVYSLASLLDAHPQHTLPSCMCRVTAASGDIQCTMYCTWAQTDTQHLSPG